MIDGPLFMEDTVENTANCYRRQPYGQLETAVLLMEFDMHL